MGKRKEIKINFKTEPPKNGITYEQFDNLLNKSISLIVDELILNGKLKIGN